MGQGGVKSKLGVSKTEANKPKPNVLRPCPLANDQTCALLNLKPVLSCSCMKSKTHNIKVIAFSITILMI